MPGNSISFDHCTIVRYPYAFIDKKDTATFIRPLAEKQHDALVSLYFNTIPRNCFNGLPPARDDLCIKWINNTVASAFNLVALSHENGIIGHACLFPMNGRMGEMLIVVAPDFRNRGIGTQLARCVIQLAFESGLDKLWLSVEAANRVARHIYNKCGFAYLTMSQIDEVEMALDLSRYRVRTGIRIGELMNKDIVTISPTASCAEVIDVILKNHVGTLPVVDNENRILGIISETDLIMEINLSGRVGDIMTREAISIREDCPVVKAIRIFQSKKVRILPVTDKTSRLVGIVGRKDILAYFYKTLTKKKKGAGKIGNCSDLGDIAT